jgi:hypothetical protein
VRCSGGRTIARAPTGGPHSYLSLPLRLPAAAPGSHESAARLCSSVATPPTTAGASTLLAAAQGPPTRRTGAGEQGTGRRQGGSPRPCSARRRRRALPTSAHPRGCREGDRELGPTPPRRIRSSPALGRAQRPRRAGSAPPPRGDSQRQDADSLSSLRCPLVRILSLKSLSHVPDSPPPLGSCGRRTAAWTQQPTQRSICSTAMRGQPIQAREGILAPHQLLALHATHGIAAGGRAAT